jgi:hypothetical protein
MKKKKIEEIIISESCFRQQVNLPVSQVSGLSDNELRAALTFEIEPFSGIPLLEGEIAWSVKSNASSGRVIFDVVQIRKSDFISLLANAKLEKKKIKGVTAPFDSTLGETLEEMPLIRPTKKKVTFNAMTCWIAVVVILFVGLCSEWLQIKSTNKNLRGELARREILQGKKNSLESNERSLREEIEKIKATRKNEIEIQNKVEALRSSWRVLLEAISSACQDEGVIRSISKTDGTFKCTIEGVALSADAASRILSRLTEKLKLEKSSWKVLPGAIGSANSGSATTFTCEVIYESGKGE